MCGIAGLIHRDGIGSIGAEMTSMLQSLRHRGPDSTGYAIYGSPGRNEFVMRFKVAEQEDTKKGFDIHDEIKRRRAKVEDRLKQLGVTVIDRDEVTEYAFRYRIQYDGEMKKLADYVEDVAGTEILSMGNALELIKDLGDAALVSSQYKLATFQGTHGIGHTRMATESDVDIRSAHPYWAYPYNDIAVVHNGQLTNYFYWRRRLERSGHRFQSECDSEIIAVYLAEKMAEGSDLEAAMRQSLEELDGVFTYICVTEDSLGMAKDELAAKPLVLYESDDMVALASEEIAIRAIIDHEIDTYDPFEGEVMVWTR
jgi:methylamine---glutamate N-methyltransferase subunit A